MFYSISKPAIKTNPIKPCKVYNTYVSVQLGHNQSKTNHQNKYKQVIFKNSSVFDDLLKREIKNLREGKSSEC